MKPKTQKKLMNMVRKIQQILGNVVCLLTLAVMVAPCFLVISVGNDGELTIWNFIGFAWMVGLCVFFKKMSA